VGGIPLGKKALHSGKYPAGPRPRGGKKFRTVTFKKRVTVGHFLIGEYKTFGGKKQPAVDRGQKVNAHSPRERGLRNSRVIQGSTDRVQNWERSRFGSNGRTDHWGEEAEVTSKRGTYQERNQDSLGGKKGRKRCCGSLGRQFGDGFSRWSNKTKQPKQRSIFRS